MRENDQDLNTDAEFFTSRSHTKNPRTQKKAPLPAADLITTPKKTRGKGNVYQNTKTGARVDLDGTVCRSAWEADVLRILQLFKIPFAFESHTFVFPADTRGRIQAYLPDVYLTKTDEYIEVKGYLDGRGRNKLRKFKKFYPEEFQKLTVVISKSNKANIIFFKKLGVAQILYYEHLAKLYANKITYWEGKKK